MKNSTALCPCQSGDSYENCCKPYHQHQRLPKTALPLMRSRYSAYVLQHIDYLIETTLPNQQPHLDKAAISHWSANTHWLGLDILQHKVRSKIHENVEFNAHFAEKGGIPQIHHENALFVTVQSTWYFVDHTLPRPSNKSPCFCGSGKKFKHCCGNYLMS